LPKRRTHEKISELLLGKSFGQVDAFLDFPSKILGGSHRRVMHTIPQAFLVGLILSQEAKGGVSGALHVIVDIVDSAAKKQIDDIIKKGDEINVRKKTKKKEK
jgi:hypothetical protein